MFNLPFDRLLTFDFFRFAPQPDRLYGLAGSTVLAAVIGCTYGLIGRVVYPSSGIYPLNYALWFAVAFQINHFINKIDFSFKKFIHRGNYFQEGISVTRSNLEGIIRRKCWKMNRLKNKYLLSLDYLVCQILHIRPYYKIKRSNVYDASFFEMCRYRVWKVFKSTIIDTASSMIAYRLLVKAGITLPGRTAVPFFIAIRSIVTEVLLIPALYFYARLCSELVGELGNGSQKAARYRALWIRKLLPAL